MKTLEANTYCQSLQEAKKANQQLEMDNLKLRQNLDQLNFELNQSLQKHQYYKSLAELKNDEIIHMSNKVNNLKKKLKEVESRRKDKNKSLIESASHGIPVIEELSDERNGSEDENDTPSTNIGVDTLSEKKVSILKKEIAEIVQQNKEFTDSLVEGLFSKLGFRRETGSSSQANVSNMSKNGNKSSLTEPDQTVGSDSVHSSPTQLFGFQSPQFGQQKTRFSMKNELGLSDRIWLNTLNIQKEGSASSSKMTKIDSASNQGIGRDHFAEKVFEFIKLLLQVAKVKFLETNSLKNSLQVDQAKLKRAKKKLEEYRKRILESEDKLRRRKRANQDYQTSNESHQSGQNHEDQQEDAHNEEENTELSVLDNYVDEFDLHGYYRAAEVDDSGLLYRKHHQ